MELTNEWYFLYFNFSSTALSPEKKPEPNAGNIYFLETTDHSCKSFILTSLLTSLDGIYFMGGKISDTKKRNEGPMLGSISLDM